MQESTKTEQRKIMVVTGSRAEYGLLKPVMEKITVSDQLLLQVVATGMHLIKEKGHTVDEIKKDFTVDNEIDMELYDDKCETLVKALGIGIKKLVDVFIEKKPDIILILGDRNEALAAAITAAQLNIPVAHIHGGDITNSGTIDESIRFSITDFAHIHFAATEKSAERIRKVGEEEHRIIFSGSPAIDAIINSSRSTKEEIMKKYQLDNTKPFVMFVHNPVTIDPKGSLHDIKIILEVLAEVGIQIIAVHPNADNGSEAMINEINKYKDNDNFKIHKNIEHQDYLTLLSYANFLIGNSTSGIIEAPTLKTPVLNIGERQKGREYFGYIKFLKPDKDVIQVGVNNTLKNNFEFPNENNPYGEGKASEKIVKVLSDVKLGLNMIRKRKCL